MRLMNHVRPTNDGNWEVRISVPADCRARLGKANLTRRLGKINKSTVNDVAAPIIAEFKETIRLARMPVPTTPLPQYADVDASLAVSSLKHWIDRGKSAAYSRVLNGKPYTGTHLGRDEEGVTELFKALARRRAIKMGMEDGSSLPILDPLIIKNLTRDGIKIEAGHPALSTLRGIVASGILEILRIEDEVVSDRNFDGVIGLPASLPSCHVQSVADVPPNSANKVVTLTDLLSGYTSERQPTEDTVERWKRSLKSLSEHVGHEEANRITPQDIISWKDTLLTTGSVAAGTFKNTYLAGVKAVFGWASENLKIASNPAINIKVRVPKKTKLRERGFTPDEARKILLATFEPKPPKMWEHTYRARRWLPWICAYGGMRVTEAAQLRRVDVREIDGHWVMNITPEAGSVKTKEARFVPVHQHLVELGFLKMVKDSEPGSLFCQPECNPSNIAGKISDWVRAIGVTDEAIQPSHAWRHLWKTRARSANIQDDVRDAIQGHATRTEGQAYGEWMIEALASAMARFPRFDVELPLSAYDTAKDTD